MNYDQARLKMIQSQIRPNRVVDERIVAAMSDVPRELFLPERLRGIAYVDEDVSLGNGRWLLEPLCCARLLQAAEIGSDDIVLVVGCGAGYLSAIASRSAGVVVGLESDEELAAAARETLSELEFDGVTVVEGNLRDGYPKQAPFDVILFDGAVSVISPQIIDQLADGGRLVAIVREPEGQGQVTVMLKLGDVVSKRTVFDAAAPLLPDFAPQPAFRF